MVLNGIFKSYLKHTIHSCDFLFRAYKSTLSIYIYESGCGIYLYMNLYRSDLVVYGNERIPIQPGEIRSSCHSSSCWTSDTGTPWCTWTCLEKDQIKSIINYDWSIMYYYCNSLFLEQSHVYPEQTEKATYPSQRNKNTKTYSQSI